MADAALFNPLGLLGLGSPAMLMSVWREQAESDTGKTRGCPYTYHPQASVQEFMCIYDVHMNFAH